MRCVLNCGSHRNRGYCSSKKPSTQCLKLPDPSLKLCIRCIAEEMGMEDFLFLSMFHFSSQMERRQLLIICEPESEAAQTFAAACRKAGEQSVDTLLSRAVLPLLLCVVTKATAFWGFSNSSLFLRLRVSSSWGKIKMLTSNINLLMPNSCAGISW